MKSIMRFKTANVVTRIALALLVLACASLAFAEGVIRLQSFPQISVADGRSTTTISAEVRDRSGRLVPDGTQVIFTTTLGSFNDPIAKTSNGIARVVFTTGSVPGAAKIQASALTLGAVSFVEVELVADRSMLSTAKEFIEITAEDALFYNVDDKVIGASGANGGVSIRYREVEIDADDVQVNIPEYTVRARKARLRIGSAIDHEFTELYFKLNSREGFGATTIQVPNYEIVGDGKLFKFNRSTRERFGIAKVTRRGVEATLETPPDRAFTFIDVLDATSTISAKKAVAFPRGQIQFHKAEMYVGTNRVMKMPLFLLNMYSGTPMVTDQVVNVYDNRLSVNYPHYLSLKPGETSLLRLRTGEKYGRGLSTSGGVFLDYEMNWNRGDDMDGGLTLSGLSRKDWSVGARQYMRLDNRTTATAQIDFPAHSSLFGNATLNRQFDGFQMNVNANASRSLRGLRFETQSASAVLEKDPTKVGKLPFRLFYGVASNYGTSTTFSRINTPNGPITQRTTLTQDTTSVRTRLQMLPIQFGGDASLSASMLVSKQFGATARSGLSTLADISLAKSFGGGLGVFMTYNYAKDGYSDRLTGVHSLNINSTFDAGRTSLAATMNRSLDIDRFSYFVDASYRISGLWRTSYSLTLDQYLGERFLEDNVALSYRLGVREIGVTYSIRNKRFGFQVFGTQFN